MALPQIRSGNLRALATTGSNRNPALPDVPTLAEAGLPGFEYHGWLGIVAPAKTPSPIIEALYRDIESVMNKPEVQADAESVGTQVRTLPPAEFAALIRGDVERYSKVIKELGITQE